MAQPVAVILVVGLNRSLIGAHSSRIKSFADRGVVRTIQPVLPAVTCSVQASMLTGLPPSQHGIIGNGWYNRELAEIHFWKQSNHLVHGEKVWETARNCDPKATCANLFWWFNMYSSADFSVTPRPIYKADGRKIPDVYTEPADLRHILQERLGQFPLFNFWGPASSIKSSQWIAQAAILTHQLHRPALNLIYLPHLDYALQKFGPPSFPRTRASSDDGAPWDSRVRGNDNASHPAQQALAEIDTVVGELIDYFSGNGVRVMILSEYGIEAVDDSIHINRLLREEGALLVREEQGLELLDPGASAAFAVADHQIAHVYIDEPKSHEYFAEFCRRIPGVEQALNREDQARLGIDHERGGDLVLIAEPGRWFSYDYWLDDSRAPDFARTVDIHRKPGYDPLELFIDPEIAIPKWAIARRLMMRKIGFRTLLDVIPLNTKLVRGSHGRTDQPLQLRPVLITDAECADPPETITAMAIRDVMLDHLGLGVRK